jgi:hypothetical protein
MHIILQCGRFVKGNFTKLGFYVNLCAMRPRILTLSIVVACLSLLTPFAPLAAPGAAQSPPPDPRFGIVEAYVNSAAATEAGAGYSRIIFRWDLIQPGGLNDWKPANVPDPYIAAELAAGRQVVAVLIGTPAWAAADGSQSPKAVPNMSYWEQFVRHMVRQYQGRIRHWIIWNEPDVWDQTHPGSTWEGTEEDYYRLLKTAYLAIKDVDPGMQVHMAGLTYFWDAEHGRRQYLDRLLDIIAADPEAPAHNNYFDAVVYHLYFKPRQSLDIMGEVQGILGAHGIMGKEIWINETNAPPSEDPQEPPGSAPRFRVSLEEQSAFVIQEFALAFAAGANRVEFYKLRNSAADVASIEPYGLLRGDDSRRPAFNAYKVVTTYLRDFRSVEWQHQNDVYAVTFDRGELTTTVLWAISRTPITFTVNAIAPQATLVDEQGNTQSLASEEGTYTIELPGAICTEVVDCFIGGAPRLLVEAGSPAGRPSLMPIARPTPQPAERAPATSTPGAQPPPETPTLTPSPSPSPSAQPPLGMLTPTPSPPPSATPVTTATRPAEVAQASRRVPSPPPEPTPLPPITPLSIMTPTRCLILILVGLVVFTVTYGLQVALWWRRQR